MDYAVYHPDDAQTSPLTDLRAVFDVRTGALTNAERLERLLDGAASAFVVPDRLLGLCVLPDSVREVVSIGDGVRAEWLIHGGWSAPNLDAIRKLDQGDALSAPTGETLAARGAPDALSRVARGESAASAGLNVTEIDTDSLLRRPWSFRACRDACIALDLELLGDPLLEVTGPPEGVTMLEGKPVHAAGSAKIMPGAILDASNGPIHLADAAVVRPGATLIGPCYIGPGSTVLDRALIKANTAIGPMCKVAGEVGGTVFQGFANKAHDGHLGDSWVGQWANLGAGTTNSNLLNTYGEVTAQAIPGAKRERTGQTFLGAVIGDHVKTAICTRLMTGVVIHTGAMIASTAPASGCIGPMSWVTDAAPRVYRLNKFLDVARAAMARRGRELSEAETEALTAIACRAEAGSDAG